MRDQLEALEKISHIDARLNELDRELEQIPAHVKELDGEVQVLRNLLEREREALREAEEWDQQAERELKIQEELLGKSRSKQAGARNERELNAALREIDDIRKAMSEKEGERLQVLEAISERRESITKHEQEIGELDSQLSVAEAAARKKAGGIDSRRAKWITAREEHVKNLRPRVNKLYEHIRSGRANAVVEILDETCQGCNMQVPAQFYIEVQRMNRIHQCPYCSRIFYFRGHQKEEE